MRKILLLAGLALGVTSLAQAQTKISATALCAAPNPTHVLSVGDTPDHAYAVAQGTCKWTKPWEIGGLKNTEGVGTQIQEVKGETTKVRGTFVDTMGNGDKAFYNFDFTLLAKKTGPEVMNHKWDLTGGTGKLQGVKGQGTCKATPVGSDGSFNYDCSGEYTLPKP